MHQELTLLADRNAAGNIMPGRNQKTRMELKDKPEDTATLIPDEAASSLADVARNDSVQYSSQFSFKKPSNSSIRQPVPIQVFVHLSLFH